MKDRRYLWIIPILVACMLIAYNRGQRNVKEKYQEEKEFLYSLNRDALNYLKVNEGPIYVIGHKSPDSDTVISAVAYADILNKLGKEAIPVITEEVNNETKYIFNEIGYDIPEVLDDASGLNVILVDHSEYAQAVEGLIDANVVAVIDHHGIGTVTTGQQILYEAKPIGSTATIIWLDYLNYGLEIDQKMAYLLLSAVLSDTDNLKVSSSTAADETAIKELAKIAKIDDIETLYNNIHAEKLSYEGFTDLEILFSDYKEYESNGVKYGIGLVNAIDEQTAAKLAKQIYPAFDQAFKERDVDLMYASIRAENHKIDYIVPGNDYSESVLKAAFDFYDEYDGISYIFKSGLGRKSKFVPGLNEYLGAKPHE